jgi:hypothetical protein
MIVPVCRGARTVLKRLPSAAAQRRSAPTGQVASSPPNGTATVAPTPSRSVFERRIVNTIPSDSNLGYFCPTPRKGKIWQKLGCAAHPSEDQTPEAGVFGAKTISQCLLAPGIGGDEFLERVGIVTEAFAKFAREAVCSAAPVPIMPTDELCRVDRTSHGQIKRSDAAARHNKELRPRWLRFRAVIFGFRAAVVFCVGVAARSVVMPAFANGSEPNDVIRSV